jgi:hypothetical protein
MFKFQLHLIESNDTGESKKNYSLLLLIDDHLFAECHTIADAQKYHDNHPE